jgi:hypothetical protein
MLLSLPILLATLFFCLTLSSMFFIVLIFDRQLRWDGQLQLRSEASASKLLKEWLSPAQLSAYEAHRYFDVVGCDTGTIYRIHQGTQGNIEQLDGSEKAVCKWCFVPQGKLAVGDVMLAQKIALETSEAGALGVANRLAILPYAMHA